MHTAPTVFVDRRESLREAEHLVADVELRSGQKTKSGTSHS